MAHDVCVAKVASRWSKRRESALLGRNRAARTGFRDMHDTGFRDMHDTGFRDMHGSRVAGPARGYKHRASLV